MKRSLMFVLVMLVALGGLAGAQQVNPNKAEFTYLQQPGTTVDLGAYYAPYGVKASTVITSKGGIVSVTGLPKALPKPNKRYKIGLALYTTVDEVGSMVLEGTKKVAAQVGVDLLVNDASYNQNTQNQAIEQWILQGVDGVIFYPSDFNACAPILQELNDHHIPVVGGNPPLVGQVNSVVVLDNVQIGRDSAQLLIDALKAQNGGQEPKGIVVWQTLPFLHPNAATREAGFMEVMKRYPGITTMKLTGISPQDHYTALEGALTAHPDIIGGWGLYDSALIGMVNARNAQGRSNVLISGVDNDRQILAGIAKGDIVGSSGYNAFNHAYWTMDFIVNILNGVEVPGEIVLPIDKIVKSNVYDLFKAYYGGRTLDDFMAGKR